MKLEQFNDYKKSSKNSRDASGEKTNLKRDLSKPENNWGTDAFGRIVQWQITNLANEIGWLKILKTEIAPDCNHPKEMQDVCGGQRYCMDCNMDL